MKRAISGIETVLLIAFIAVTSLVLLNVYSSQKMNLAKINTVTPRDEVVNDAVTADEAVATSYQGGLTSSKVAAQTKDSKEYTGSNENEVETGGVSAEIKTSGPNTGNGGNASTPAQTPVPNSGSGSGSTSGSTSGSSSGSGSLMDAINTVVSAVSNTISKFKFKF